MGTINRTVPAPATVRVNGLRLRHTARALRVRWSRRGDVLVTVGADGRAVRWNTHDGTQVRALAVGDADLHSAFALSDDGTRLVTGNRRLWVWDVTTGRRLIALAHPAAVVDADVSPGGALVATGSRDHGLRLFDAETGDARAHWRLDGPVLRVRFSPDGRHVLVVAAGELQLFTVDGVRVATRACAGEQGHVCAAFTPDGAAVIAAPVGARTLLRLRVPTLETLDESMIDAPIASLDVSPDGRLAAFAGPRRPATPSDASPPHARVWLWHLDRWQIHTAFVTADVAVRDLAFSSDGASIATLGGGAASVWRTADGSPVLMPDAGFSDSLCDAVWLDRNTVLVRGDDRQVAWSLTEGRPVVETPFAPYSPLAPCEGGFVARDGGALTRWRWDGNALAPTWSSNAPDDVGDTIACNAAGDAVFATGMRALTAWRDGAREPAWTRPIPQGQRFVLACAPDGAWLVVASAFDGSAWFRVETLRGDETRMALPASADAARAGFDAQLGAAAVTPDGSRVLLARVNGDVEVCDANTGARVLHIPSRVRAHCGALHRIGRSILSLSPDGREVAVCAPFVASRRVWIFSVDDGALCGESTQAERVIDAVRWSPDGERLLTVGFDGVEVRVWRVAAMRARATRLAQRAGTGAR